MVIQNAILETILGSIRNGILYHSKGAEAITYNRFNKDIPYTYIQIRRMGAEVYVIDYLESGSCLCR